MVKTLNMTERIKCQKIDKYFSKHPPEVFENI